MAAAPGVASPTAIGMAIIFRRSSESAAQNSSDCRHRNAASVTSGQTLCSSHHGGERFTSARASESRARRAAASHEKLPHLGQSESRVTRDLRLREHGKLRALAAVVP